MIGYSVPFPVFFWCKQKGHLTMPKRNVFRMNFVKCCYGFVNFPFRIIVNIRSKNEMEKWAPSTDPTVDRLLSEKYSYHLSIQFAQCFSLFSFSIFARLHGILIV